MTLSEQKVSVEPSHDYAGNTCDHKAECAMFGLDMIANHEAKTSQQEVEVDEWNELEFVLAKPSGQNELVHKRQHELFQCVRENTSRLLDKIVISS